VALLVEKAQQLPPVRAAHTTFHRLASSPSVEAEMWPLSPEQGIAVAPPPSTKTLIHQAISPFLLDEIILKFFIIIELDPVPQGGFYPNFMVRFAVLESKMNHNSDCGCCRPNQKLQLQLTLDRCMVSMLSDSIVRAIVVAESLEYRKELLEVYMNFP
jgi:hypothetical protein